MKTIYKFIILSIILLMVGLTTVSASDLDTTTDTSSSSDTLISTTDDISSDLETTTEIASAIEDSTNVQTTTDKINKTDDDYTNSHDKLGSTHKITNKTYSAYFVYNSTTERVQTATFVTKGDVLDLSGTFKNVNFTVDKNITLTSSDHTARLINCTVNVQGLSSAGATISNLNITNNNYYGSGIYVNITKNITIKNNTIHVWGPFSFALAADQMNGSTVLGNYFETSCREDMNRTHTAAAFGLCYYNTIKNNRVVSDQANGIYFSVYGSGLFQGGYCDNNYVIGNDVTGGNTTWSYTIQIMGKNNTIVNNTVRNGSRGISTQSFTDNYLFGNFVDAVDQGIYACEGAIVENNTVNVKYNSTGIETGGIGVIIKNNNITTINGIGIKISSSNVKIYNNSIKTDAGYGIYTKGYYSQFNITGNQITSGKTGILLKKQSSNKRPNYINITRNIINSLNSDYAVDLYEAGARDAADAVINVDSSNVLASKSGVGLEKAYLGPENVSSVEVPDSNKTYTITDSTYYSYFDETGTVNTKKILKGDTVILKGRFYNKDFIFTVKVKVIGRDNRIFNGSITFTEDADSSSVRNVSIYNVKSTSIWNRHGVNILEVNNCNVTDNTITNDDLWESVGVFVYSSAGNIIRNNSITTWGDYVNYGILLYGCDLNTIKNNTIRVMQSNKPLEYADEIMLESKIGNVREILHAYGIILLYSSSNTIEQNRVFGASAFKEYVFPTEDCKNSMVGIDLYYDSSNNKVLNNTVIVSSYGPYNYGMGVLGAPWGTDVRSLNATNNLFKGNYVQVKGGYFATAFIAGLNSLKTVVDNNTFYVSALRNATQYGDYAYGITLESSSNSTIINNFVGAYGAACYCFELFDSQNNTIKNNYATARSTNPYILAGYRTSYNNITNNTFVGRYYNYGVVNTAMHSDAIPYGKEVVYLMTNSFNNTLKDNEFTTNATNVSVLLQEQAINNTIRNNSIKSTNQTGDLAVVSKHKSNIVKNNFQFRINMKVYATKAKVGTTHTFGATISAVTGSLVNLTATFKLGATTIGTSKVVNKTATVTYTIPSSWRATTYTLTVSVKGDNFENKTGNASVVLIKDPTATKVKVETVYSLAGKNVVLKANITDINNNNIEGQAYVKLNGTTLATVNVTLGKANYTYKIPASMKPGPYNVTFQFIKTSDYAPSLGSAYLGVQTKSVGTASNITAGLGKNVKLTARFTVNGAALANGTVDIYINGNKIGTTNVSKGVASLNYALTPTKYNKGVYKVNYVLNQSYNYTSVNVTQSLNITPFDTVILVNNTTTTVGKSVSISVKICNASKNYFAKSGNAGIKINGVTLKYDNGTVVTVNVVNGSATFKFTATASLVGTNNITITYSGNNQFNSAKQNCTLTIKSS